MNEPPIAVIIPSWNRRADTLECLGSLRQSTYPPNRTGIFVSDNGSSDGTIEAVRACFEEMRPQGWRELVLLENGRNLGFAGAVNAAYSHLAPDYAFLFLTNNDVAFLPETLPRVVEPMRADASIGVAGAKVLSYHQPSMLAHGAGYLRPFLCGTRSVDAAEQRDCDFVTGCALCVRRTVVERLGCLLDDAYFAYWEDTDLCARVRAAGFRVVYLPDAALLHKVGVSTSTDAQGSASPARVYLETFGKMLYARKHLPGWRRAVFHGLFLARIPWFAARTMTRAPRQASRLIRAYGKAVAQGLRGGPGGPYSE